jgi:hypothetical protein
MPALQGLHKVQQHFASLRAGLQGSKHRVIVGYSQSYAMIVHEDLQAHHKEGKQAKFLEGPARQHQAEIAQTINRAYVSTGNLDQAMLLGGLRLQRLSQEVCPVDTGALRASAYTCFEENEERVAAEALFHSNLVAQGERKK